MALTDEDFEQAAAQLGCDAAAIRAVCEVEAPRGGFNPDGTPRTLFEGHWFYRLTKGAYAAEYPTICYPKWTKQFYGKTWEQEAARLSLAISLDREQALKSASWGRFQIMGFNHKYAGYDDVESFVAAMCESEGAQLQAFCAFIKSQGLADELQNCQWAKFAYRYNGEAYAENHYDTKLAAAYDKFSGEQA
jgi:hypothetical protein